LPNALPPFAQSVALGDPARNLFAAGLIYASVRDRESAVACFRAAADADLPEARALLGQ
jgi:hypothetical protein